VASSFTTEVASKCDAAWTWRLDRAVVIDDWLRRLKGAGVKGMDTATSETSCRRGHDPCGDAAGIGSGQQLGICHGYRAESCRGEGRARARPPFRRLLDSCPASPAVDWDGCASVLQDRVYDTSQNSTAIAFLAT
jgi:hypothetical protein